LRVHAFVCSSGDDFPNVATLLETVFELQVEREPAAAADRHSRSNPASSTVALSMPEGW